MRKHWKDLREPSDYDACPTLSEAEREERLSGSILDFLQCNTVLGKAVGKSLSQSWPSEESHASQE